MSTKSFLVGGPILQDEKINQFIVGFGVFSDKYKIYNKLW